MKVGFIGLGKMGHGMVVNLLKNDHKVFVFDIDVSKIKSAKKFGAFAASTIKDIASQVDVIFLCLPHPKISEKVIFGKQGIINSQESKIDTIIETSTLTPEMVVNFERKLKKQNINFISAPMFCGQDSADAGKIWFVVEGDKIIFTKYQNLFSAMGEKISYMGEIPQATIAKLARNICRFSNVAAAIEVIDFLRKTTKDIEPIYNLLVEESKTNFDRVWEDAVYDYALKNKNYQASNISVKDLKLILKIAKEKNVDMPITKMTKRIHKKFNIENSK